MRFLSAILCLFAAFVVSGCSSFVSYVAFGDTLWAKRSVPTQEPVERE